MKYDPMSRSNALYLYAIKATVPVPLIWVCKVSQNCPTSSKRGKTVTRPLALFKHILE